MTIGGGGDIRGGRQEQYYPARWLSRTTVAYDVTIIPIIVSPWLDEYVVDTVLPKHFGGALKRRVKVRIAWGLGTKKRGAEAERNLQKANPVISKLRAQADKGA